MTTDIFRFAGLVFTLYTASMGLNKFKYIIYLNLLNFVRIQCIISEGLKAIGMPRFLEMRARKHSLS